MSERNTVVRSLHDLGMAAWFGGSLMGAVGVNGAAAKAKDPTERLRLSSIGWARWAPWQIAAITAHSVGGIGVIVSNRKRLTKQPGAGSLTVAKLLVTAAALAASTYSGVLGLKISKHADEGGAGVTEPSSTASSELAVAQSQLKVLQWVTPVLTGTLTVMGALEGEQQRGLGGLLDLGGSEVKHTLKQAVHQAV